MRNLTLTAAFVLALPALAAANEPAVPASVLFPGSLNISAANGEPTEPGNVASSGTVSQGVSIARKGSTFVVGFVDVTMRADSTGYEWNNTRPYRSGVKLVHVDSHGVFEAAAGLMADGRESSKASTHRTVSVSYWRGWRGDALGASSGGLRPKSFPGSAYAVSGYLTSREARNWITNVSVDQGATVFSHRDLSVGPFVRAAASVDAEGRPWNNRSRLDSGIKLTHRLLSGVVDGGVARRYTFSRSAGGPATTSTVVFVELWLGWTPRAIFK
jgi:hypothetical protein